MIKQTHTHRLRYTKVEQNTHEKNLKRILNNRPKKILKTDQINVSKTELGQKIK